MWVSTLFIVLGRKHRCGIGCAILRALSVHIMTIICVAPCILVDTKVKVFLHTPWKHVSELGLTLGLEGGELSVSLSGRITPVGSAHPSSLNRRMGVPQSRSGLFWEEKYIFPLPGFKPRFVQSVTLAVSWLSCMATVFWQIGTYINGVTYQENVMRIGLGCLRTRA